MSAPTIHTKGCNDAKCARTYQVDPGDAVFVCARCERRVGWCMGADDDMPALCDDCFGVVDAAPDRELPAPSPEWRPERVAPSVTSGRFSRDEFATDPGLVLRAALNGPVTIEDANGTPTMVISRQTEAIDVDDVDSPAFTPASLTEFAARRFARTGRKS